MKRVHAVNIHMHMKCTCIHAYTHVYKHVPYQIPNRNYTGQYMYYIKYILPKEKIITWFFHIFMMSPSPDFRCISCRSVLFPTLYVELPVMELSAESTTSPCDVPTGIPLQLTEESRDPKFNTTKYLRWPVSPLTYEMMSSFTVENTIFLFVNAGFCLSLARLL